MKPTKCPAREKKMRQEKQKNTWEERNLEILLTVHAQTSQADILHLDQKAMGCTTCKPVCGYFFLFCWHVHRKLVRHSNAPLLSQIRLK